MKVKDYTIYAYARYLRLFRATPAVTMDRGFTVSSTGPSHFSDIQQTMGTEELFLT